MQAYNDEIQSYTFAKAVTHNYQLVEFSEQLFVDNRINSWINTGD